MTELSLDAFQGSVARLSTQLQASWQILSDVSDELYRSSLPLRETSRFSGTLADTRGWYEASSRELLSLLSITHGELLRELPAYISV